MNKMIWAISFIALTISSSFAQRLPPTVQRAAETLVRECAEDRKIKNLDLSQLDTITRFYQFERQQSIFIVDFSKTKCPDCISKLCGTGGCPLSVFVVSGGVVATIFDENAFGFEFDRRKRNIIIPVHHSYCREGNTGACKLFINLRTFNRFVRKRNRF